MKLKHLLWLGIFCFVIAATSSPTSRSSMRATREKLSRQSEKKRAPTEEERNERRSANALTDNDEEDEEREEEGSETADFERRGNDYYGSRRSDEELDNYVLQAIVELLAVEANTTEQELDEELKQKVNTVTKMADFYGFTNTTPLTPEERAALGLEKKGVEEVEDDDAKDMDEKKKRFEGTGEEETEDWTNLREGRGSVVERHTFPFSGLGTLLYNTTKGLSLSKCRDICRSDNKCDSVLVILNKGLCILHQDI